MSAPVPILPGNRAVRYICNNAVCKRRHDGTYGSGKYCGAACVPNFPCEVCSKLHDSSYGSGRFCSSRCSRNVCGTRRRKSNRTAAAGSSKSTRKAADKKNTRHNRIPIAKRNEEEQDGSRLKMSVYSLLN